MDKQVEMLVIALTVLSDASCGKKSKKVRKH